GSDEYKWRLRDALGLCSTIASASPGSVPASSCRELREAILQENFSLVSDGVVIPGQPSLMRVDFRNTPTLYVRLYRIDPSDALTWCATRRTLDENTDRLVASETPVASTEYALPVDGDHQSHSTELMLPSLDVGAYVIVAGNAADLNRNAATRFV